MKKQNTRTWIVLTALLAALLLAAGCGGNDASPSDTAPTASPKSTASGATAIAATSAPSETTPEAATPAATAESPEKQSLTADQLGKPFPEDLEGVELLLSQDYETDDFAIEKVTEQGENITVSNGKMNLCLDADGNYIDSWAGWGLDFPCFLEDYEQYELSFELQSFKPAEGKSAWDAFFMGAFISDCTGAKPYYTNANETADGFWVTFTNETQVNVCFGGINWPNPLVTISVPEGFDTAKRLYVITNQNGVYYWMETAAGEQILLVSAIFTEDDSTVTVYDGSGQSVWSGANEIDRSVGGFFRAFNHFCPTQIDNLLLKAY